MQEYKNPYPNLNINDYSGFYKCDRFKCPGCNKNRKFYCYTPSCNQFINPDAIVKVPKIEVS